MIPAVRPPRVEAERFDRHYEASADPWDYRTSLYEREKYTETLSALPPGSFERVLEVGCSIGVFTEMLAPRCEHLVAIDFSPQAVTLAHARLDKLANVELIQASFPETIPAGKWDLVVCSEVLYYLDHEALLRAIDWLHAQLENGASVLAVSWRGKGSEEPLRGDEAHDLLTVELARWHAFDGRQPGYRLDRFDWQNRDLSVSRCGHAPVQASDGGLLPVARGPEIRPVLPEPDPQLRVVVVVPARDEAARIGGCLYALASQRGVQHKEYEVIVVLDGCRDATRERVQDVAVRVPSLRLHTVELPQSEGVGRARRCGMDIASLRLSVLRNAEGLIASTDADSTVAHDWLSAQLELVQGGAHAIGGYIELHPGEADQLAGQALIERDRRGVNRMQTALSRCSGEPPTEHHQFSGASLALTVETYRRCGGLPVRAALEDEALERELSARGVPIHRSRSVHVTTSARTDGRAPRGLAHDLARSNWRAGRSYRADEFPLERLLSAKSTSVALVLPSREVAGTIGPIANHAMRLYNAGLLDEVLVVDAESRDGSAQIAGEAGLTVMQEDELFSELGPALGKGDAMWRALGTLNSDIVAFADTDTENFEEHFLTGLLGPLICEPAVQLVKGFFRRPFRSHGTLVPQGGGRVTELMARPLLNLHAPELAVFDQPLAGEMAARRGLLEQIPFSAGYGVEIAMLIDAWRLVGLDGLAQVDLGTRQNRHQSLRELSAMAYAVLIAAQSRFLGSEFADAHACGSIFLPPIDVGDAMEPRHVTTEERPPLAVMHDGSRFATSG